MLDFLLVLGLIPGTNFQITFYEIILFSLAFASWVFRVQLKRYLLAKRQEALDFLRAKYWQWRQLSLPL
jgi:hypothetical protein